MSRGYALAARSGAIVEKLAFRRAVGVYVGDHELTVCQIGHGPLGQVVLSSQTEPYEPEDLSPMLDRVLKPLLPGKRSLHAPVSIGLPTLRVFFAARPLQLADRDLAANVLLHDVLKSSNVNVDDMQVDLIKAEPGKRRLGLLLAGRRKYIASLLSIFAEYGVRPHRMEPAPFALLRLSAIRHRSPRRAKTVVRVFLGESNGVAVLVHNDLPLAWRAFEMPAGSEASAVCSGTRAIQIVARFRCEIGSSDAVLIHGRPDLSEVLDTESVKATFGVPTQHFPDPAYEGSSIAEGLALGALEGEEAFDLSRELKPRPPVWQIFPVGDVALQVALLVCITLFLSSKYEAAQNAQRLLKAEAAKHAWIAKVDAGKLEKEKKELEAKITAVKDYLDTRILWTHYTRDSSARLPDALVLRSLSGQCEFESAKGVKTKPKKSLSLKLSAPIPSGQSMPREIDTYLERLRRDADLQRDFPNVELADLKWNQPMAKGATALAEFTVNCLPNDKPKPPPGGELAKTKAKGA
jgi:hypothetical protein